jgi:hypothetical protein
MESDMVADMQVDKVADMEVDRKADIFKTECMGRSCLLQSIVVNGGWAVAHPPILRLPKRSDKVTNDKKIKFITLTYY